MALTKISSAGIQTSPSFSGSSTFTGNVNITGVTTIGNDLIISSTLPRITLNDTNNESDFDIKNENGSFRIRDLDNPTDRYRINSSGTIHEFFGAADFNSNLTVDGTLNANQLNFGDSNGSSTNIALFGDSNDLKIYHNGSHSIVQETGSGGLLLLGSFVELATGSGSEKYFRGVENGSAILYHNNVERLETTSSGANVTGNFGASGNITLSGSIQMPDALQHMNDTTTQIRFPGPGTFSVDISGTERLRIHNTGLNVTGVATFSASAHISNANGSLFFGAGNATAYGSQAGIGRASTDNFHIGNSLAGDLCIGAEGSKRIIFGTKTGTGIGGLSKRLQINADGTTQFHGSLTSPSLTVTSSNAVINLTTTQTSFQRKGEINHFHNNGSTAHNKITFAPRNGSTGRIIFNNMVGGTLTERLRLDGNDGIQPSTHVIPMNDSSYNLGNTSNRWLGVYSDALDVAGNVTISGNLNIGGVVTYEDVTSVDSIGIVTARSGVIVPSNDKSVAVGAGGVFQMIRTTTHGSQLNTTDGGDIRFRTGGTTRGRFYSTGLEVVGRILVDGTLEHRGDSDTSLGFPATDTISFTTAGAERLRITSQGAIQLSGGTNGHLQIDNNGEFEIFESNTSLAMNNSSKIAMDFNGNVARIRSSTNGSASIRPLGFFMGAVEKLRITPTGRVGIGTANPIAQLDVNVGSSVTAFNVEGSEGQLFSVTNNLSSGSIFAVNDITGLPSVDVNADGTIQLAPRGAGELVGIGTTSPTSKLHIVGDTLTTGFSTFRNKVQIKPLTAQTTCLTVGCNDAVRLTYTNANQSYLQSSAHFLSIANNNVFIQRFDTNCTMASFKAGAENSFTWNYVKRLSTSSIGATVFGQLDTTDLNVSGVSTMGQTTISHTGAPQLIIKDSDTTGAADSNGISFRDASNTQYGFLGQTSSGGHTMIITTTNTVNPIRLQVNQSTKLEVGHTGTYVQNGHFYVLGGCSSNLSGDVNINSNAPTLNFNDTNHNSDFMLQNANGLFKLYDNTNTADRVTVASNGNVSVKQNLEVAGISTVTGTTHFTKQLNVAGVSTFNSDVKIGDAATFHDNGGQFQLKTSYFNVKSKVGEDMIIAYNNEYVRLFHNGNQKFTTTHSGAIVTGVMTATSFSGDGSNLTGIGAAVQSGAPSSANEGDLWYDTDDGRIFVYYNDGSSAQWVDASPNGTPTDLVVEGSTSLKGSATTRAIVPETDSTYDLGTNSNRFANVYADALNGSLAASNLTGALPAIDGSNLTGVQGIPSGGIIMWSGATNLIGSNASGGTGSGWVLCDGNNGTPDLRDRFVVGASDSTGDTSYPGLSPDATGGSADATLVSHTHNLFYNHGSFGGSSGAVTPRGTNTPSTPGISGRVSTEGSSATNANLPPYYALAYIMKT